MNKPKPLALPNPVNANPSFDAEHTLYVAGTGGGKTSAVKHLGLIPKTAQAVFFDPYTNYAGNKFQGQMCHGTSSRLIFVKSLVMARRRGGSFKLAYIPANGATGGELEFFASVVWSVGNGRASRLYTVIEELASCVETSGKLRGRAGELFRGGRQYGLVVHSIFQRGQEVPKTVTEQSSVWWVGAVNSMSDAQWIADKRGLDVNTIATLKSAKVNKQRIGKPIAEYLLIREGIGNIEHKALNCQSGSRLNLNYR
ncbi:Helicase HerA central domain-containing protein [Vibrio crassostreae]|uniref:hypothetical protein n=1 Tax=Vibrio TaxID=662 RepID=UPI0010D9ADEF|nr:MULTISPECIES: hypothetical protein [Vibrio]MDH5939828.1 hypothetical protein [Vibrio splendidus]TCT54895.1 hypothetical protein EDB44_14015 [Vibrio crassostreae]TCT74921.1 hypothetical protein EDB43_14015 [Vibrio crassostreae]TCW05543.1 hypothetical protein EDB49_108177 [Vibrio crassostreae]CAK1769061.1 Helicase HerA central domain-containing protein [Vibrio crassostreae]